VIRLAGPDDADALVAIDQRVMAQNR